MSSEGQSKEKCPGRDGVKRRVGGAVGEGWSKKGMARLGELWSKKEGLGKEWSKEKCRGRGRSNKKDFLTWVLFKSSRIEPRK